MNELMELVDNFKKSLDKTKEVQEIKEYNKKISLDKDLLSKIKKYNDTKDESLKKEIISNKLFNEYKEKEIDFNILILKINKELKRISTKKGCSL
ncbi:MAG: YlbF family regulator [Bacilli bacterium]|nr:YlbF family regulator [Bacilli bacterium]